MKGVRKARSGNVNTRIASSSTAPSATATNECGGSIAFSVDNISSAPQAARICLGTLFPPGSGTSPCGAGNYCAVKLTRSGLQ
jgi:hypothetical protein